MSHLLLTIDVEDWFQVENLRPWFPLESWSHQQVRLKKNVRSLLNLFADISSQRTKPVRATFFVLGWVAERMPELVSEIHSHGHEVASHGYSHQLCSEQTTNDLSLDLQSSRKLLEEIIGQRVRGYRAPSFSISEKVLDEIKKAGYLYDASFNSFSMNSRYGRIATDNYLKKGIALDMGDNFYELPLTNLHILGRCIPWSGGGYFRLFPELVFKYGVNKILSSKGAYHFYMHPWEIDPGQPRQSQASFLCRLRHYINLEKTLDKLSGLITSFNHCEFTTCSDYLYLMGAEGFADQKKAC